ncbi:MAG: LCP family protein [Spirochaetaceae bacterium]|jgi:anionic cell wall polymer biosynthesis LytR-Cps2A-Psr (LCP) family protein|nr:LCP family protein [Spirochaetaceae bacterium]
MSKRQMDISSALLVLILLIFVAGFASAIYILNPDKLENEIAGDRPINTLFVLENDKKPLSTFVLLYYPATKRMAFFDIAGETGLLLRKINRVDRIDTVYDPRSVSSYVQEVERLLDLDINYEMVFDMDSLGKTVDLLDGVTVFVPTEVMIYDGADSIIFDVGYNNLDGYKTNIYLTYTHDDDDIETVRLRRERFFSGFIRRLGEKNSLLKNKDLAAVFSELIKTNMNTKTRIRLFDEWSKIDTNRINIQTVGGNYRDVSGQRLLFPYYDGNLIKDIVRQTLSALTRSGVGNSERVFTVEVLNGTTTAGLAGRTAELIRGFGYDVIEIGNTDRNDYEKTVVVDRSGVDGEAKVFAGVINCQNITSENIHQLNNDMPAIHELEYKADFTLIIGKDFNGRYTQAR